MRSLLVAIVTGLVGAVILHIVIVFALPRFAPDDAWTKVQALGAPQQFHNLTDAAGGKGPRDVDPFVRSAVCVFHDDGQPIRITAGAPPSFWSLAVFDTKSNEIYSMTDRSAAERRVNVTLATPQQSLALRRKQSDDGRTPILVDLTDADGYVVLRSIATDPTQLPGVGRFLKGAECSPPEAS